MAVIVIMTSLAGCIGEEESDSIKVAVTILPQKQMDKAIGGDLIEVTALVPSGQSVHDFTPTPSLIAKMSQSDAYVKVGTGVEFETLYMNTILEQNPGLTVIDSSIGIEMLPLLDSDGTVDDPHIWTNFTNLEVMANNVLAGLSELFPEHAEAFAVNHTIYVQTLQDARNTNRDILSGIEGDAFLVYHPSWSYFSQEYGLTMLSVEKGDKEPTAISILEVIDEARNAGVTVVVFPPQFDRDTAEYIADEVGGEAVFVDPLIEDIIAEIEALATHLSQGADGSG